MPEELGEIKKPSVDEFKVGRRLYFVPLLFFPKEPRADLLERLNRYWDQADAHVAGLEGKLGRVCKVYHEFVPVGGEAGAKTVEELNRGSHRIVKARLEKGAELQPMEDGELLTEFMDWGRCLAVGLQNQKVVARVYEAYVDASRRRNSHIAKQIDETLKKDETGLLLMSEGHQVQFPTDIEVFYIAPPALDEIKRWLREREPKVQSQGEGPTS